MKYWTNILKELIFPPEKTLACVPCSLPPVTFESNDSPSGHAHSLVVVGES